MKKSKFDQWFTQQFGKRPSKLSLEELYRQQDLALMQFTKLQKQCRDLERWIDASKAALYAWNAREQREEQ